MLASRTLRSRRFDTGSSKRKSRQRQIGRPVQVFRLRGINHHSRPGVLSSTLRNAQSLLPDPDAKRLVRKPVLANGLPRSRKTCRTAAKNDAACDPTSQLVAEQLRLRFPEEFKTGRFRRKRAELLIRCTTNMRRSFDKLTIYAVQTPISRTIPKKSEKVVDSMGQYRHNNFCCFDVRRYLSWIEGLTTNQYVGGSNPSRRTISASNSATTGSSTCGFFIGQGKERT